ncbi:hypothetical protein DFH07DRAFT_805682 [Mycena maculata]|uniref:Uncharacterized protein n=1 Tax=Mycena maculata TaxID=230809 RepID=A0AAD7JST5_9AGAR|nr:hypothetical protein DFH07DRAFT_805682 [Mycena maculata]
MHQSHNIAWDSLSSNLTFIHENRRVTPPRTDLFPRHLASQAQSLNHFARTLVATIRKFSDTERAKYAARYDAPLTGPVFSDSILFRYQNLDFPSVTAENQLIENWIEWAGRAGPEPSYSTSQGDLADVVKVLLAENEMDQLLMLAQHPRIPIAQLHSLSWGHSFGWNHAMHWALDAYILFNILLSKPELHEHGRYKSMRSYKRVVGDSIAWGDYDAQCFPHREFYLGSLVERVARGSIEQRAAVVDALDPLGDSDKLHEYLKMCFRMLYQYDMVARECGLRLDWEGTIAKAVGNMWTVKVDHAEDEEHGWIARFA